MTDTPPTGPHGTDIGLSDLVLGFWDNRWTVAIVTTVVLIAAVLVAVVMPQRFTATTEVHEITSFERFAYNELNSLAIYSIDRNKLFEAFIELFESREELQKAIVDHELVDPDEFESDAEYRDAVIRVSHRFVLLDPTERQESDQQEPIETGVRYIQYEGTDRKKTLAVLDQSLNAVNADVRALIQEEFRQTIENRKTANRQQLLNIEREIENARKDYMFRTQSRSAFLREQLELAKALNIKNPRLVEENIVAGSTILTTGDRNLPYYYRGTDAIQREIALVQERDNPDYFVESIAELLSEKTDLETELSTQWAEEAFAATPVTDPERFKAARFAVQSTRFENQSSRLMFVAIGLALGLIISACIVIFKLLLRSRST